MKNIKAQLLLMLRRKTFIIALTLMMLLSAAAFIANCSDRFGDFLINIPAAKYLPMLNNFQAVHFPADFYNLIFPLIIAVPFADSFFEEREKSTAIYGIIRSGNNSYYFSKLFAVFISGVIITGIPLLTNYLLNFTAFPLDSVNTCQNFPVPECQMFTQYELDTLIFSKLYCSNMYLYNLLYIFINMLTAGLSAAIVFQISFFYKNSRIILLCMFFVVYHMENLIAVAFSRFEYRISSYILAPTFHTGQTLTAFAVLTGALLLAAAIPIPFAKRRLKDLI